MNTPKRPLPVGIKVHSEHAKKVFSGTRFDVYQWEQKQFDGSTATYEVIKRNDSVIVIPVIGDEIIVVKEQQPHWDKPGIALVAGMTYPDEDLEVAARRELEEETGMVFKNYYLVYIEPLVAGVEWFGYHFIATDLVETKEKKLDAGEMNEVMKLSIDKLLDMTRNQGLVHRPRFIENYLIKDDVAGLKEILKNPSKYEIK